MTVTQSGVAVRRAAASDHPAMGVVLSRGFYADPVFEWAFPDPARRRAVLPGFFDTFIWAYSRHDELYVAGEPSAAALWVPAGVAPVHDDDADEFDARLAEVCSLELGTMATINELFAQHHPHEPHFYLNLLATLPESQRKGYGSALLSDMTARLDREQQPAYLEATSADNRRLYERHGFETVAEMTLPDGPTLYPMWRVPRAA